MVGPRMGSFHTMRYSALNLGNSAVIIKILLLLNIIIAVCGVLANALRNKRKTDKFRSSLIVSSIVSLIGFVFVIAKL
jgi:uncharacterized membrane protein YoaK (UPF0700 family)